MTPRFGNFLALSPHGFTRVAYADWGPPDSERVVICAHGMTRNARDFDRLADFAAVEAYLRQVHVPFGKLTDFEWRHLSEHGAVPDGSGRLRLHYDPAIAQALTAGPMEDIALWPVWDRVACPVLVIRGAASGLLLKEMAAEMLARGAADTKGMVEFVEIPPCIGADGSRSSGAGAGLACPVSRLSRAKQAPVDVLSRSRRQPDPHQALMLMHGSR